MIIAVDAMGGDFAPQVEVEGAIQVARDYGTNIILVGDKKKIEDELKHHDYKNLKITIHHASEVVEMYEAPSLAIRRKKDSSIRIAFELVKNGQADAVVSAGNSGAAMAIGMLVLRTIEGIERPAIAAILPNMRRSSVLIDAGGNIECKPINLVQFAVMGEVYARYIFRIDNPRVGVLSNGKEDNKGNELTRETNYILKNSTINYIGYVEGRDIFYGKVDVIICDGFVGNVVLKISEGLADAINMMLKDEISRSLTSKIGYLFVKKAFMNFRKRVDYSEYGGAPLLGLDGVGIVCHGGSPPKAMRNAIRLACHFIENNINRKMEEELRIIFKGIQNWKVSNSTGI